MLTFFQVILGHIAKLYCKVSSDNNVDYQEYIYAIFQIKIGSGALSGKMLLVRIVENNKIDYYLRAG